MWLIVTFIAAIAATAMYLESERLGKLYKLDFLALMLWGTFIMVLVDHLIAFMEEGTFIELTTDGLIESSAVLGLAMIVPILIIWMIAVFFSLKKVSKTN